MSVIQSIIAPLEKKKHEHPFLKIRIEENNRRRKASLNVCLKLNKKMLTT